ncbi:MAG TPA: hypothetical protein VGM90_08235 [Kofleriaceae bacterium]|jgi:hypothetical protein
MTPTTASRPPPQVPLATPFGEIMRRAVESTPGAIGGAFADAEGEMVDGYTTIDRDEWAIITAHYGVVLVNLHSAFNTMHFGSPKYFIAQYERMDVIVQSVAMGYFALLAVRDSNGASPLGAALASLEIAAAALAKEIT